MSSMPCINPCVISRRLFACVAMLSFALTLGGCEVYDSIASTAFIMSPDQEKQAGAEFAKQVEQQMPPVQDAQVNAYIQKLGSRIWQNAPQGAIEPRFHVVNDPSINAFAIPGGDVYVHTGLIEAADNEAELAGVIAHEVGHVIHRHGAAQVSRQTSNELLSQLVLGTESGQASQIAASLINQGVMFRYSREDEREADAVAVQTLHHAGYDPMALRTFFDKLLQEGGSSGGSVATFFSTHPATEERIANVTAMAKALPPKQYEKPVNDLRAVQSRLKQLGM